MRMGEDRRSSKAAQRAKKHPVNHHQHRTASTSRLLTLRPAARSLFSSLRQLLPLILLLCLLLASQTLAISILFFSQRFLPCLPAAVLQLHHSTYLRDAHLRHRFKPPSPLLHHALPKTYVTFQRLTLPSVLRRRSHPNLRSSPCTEHSRDRLAARLSAHRSPSLHEPRHLSRYRHAQTRMNISACAHT